jgi:hypothetical protein
MLESYWSENDCYVLSIMGSDSDPLKIHGSGKIVQIQPHSESKSASNRNFFDRKHFVQLKPYLSLDLLTGPY